MRKGLTNYGQHKRTVLVVDDELINREILGNILDEEYNVLYAENGAQAIEILRNQSSTISIVLLDLNMPVMDGFQVIEITKSDEYIRDIPFIVLTSEKTAETKSLKMGAADFIKKPYDVPEVILARVWRIIELYEGRMIIKSTEKDPLTGVLSKGFFFEYASLMNRYDDIPDMDAVVLNFFHFGLFNELYGFNEGDKVLKTIANVASEYVSKYHGIISRYDGDIFYLYMDHHDSYKELDKDIKKELEKNFKNHHAHVNIGIYHKPQDENNLKVAFDKAKSACSKIKYTYQNSIAIYDQTLHDKNVYYEQLIHDIHDGIADNQLKVYLQPKYYIKDDVPRLGAAEALVRWQHPKFGMVSPGDFITLFEENGLIQLVDRYVWNETAKAIRNWKDTFGKAVPVSVNVSRVDILDPNIVEIIKSIVDKNGLSSSDLHLEITESAYSSDMKQLIETVCNLRNEGFEIEMDDFGSGYSSLNMLTSLPIDVLKMDMKFVRSMDTDPTSFKVIKLILEIANFLSVPVVAEGVENETQYKMLKDEGCDYIQGYYFSKPLPKDEFTELLKKSL